MNNVELFRNSEFSQRFDNWTKRNKEAQSLELLNLFSDFSVSTTFGFFIYDNNLCDLSRFFSREYFANNFNAILQAFEKAGTYNSYLLVIKSALGAGTVVTFENPSPSHLVIKIEVITELRSWGALQNHSMNDLIPDQVQYPNQTLAFSVSLSPLTVNETIKLINLLNVNGVYIEIDFNT